jgi:hypothetical protein
MGHGTAYAAASCPTRVAVSKDSGSNWSVPNLLLDSNRAQLRSSPSRKCGSDPPSTYLTHQEMESSKHEHNEHGRPASESTIEAKRPKWRRIHHDWRFWVFLVLTVVAMVVYITSQDLSGGGPRGHNNFTFDPKAKNRNGNSNQRRIG